MSISVMKRGGYRVDVQYKGQRIRELVMGSLEQAQIREREIRKQLIDGTFSAPVKQQVVSPQKSGVTMRDLFDLKVREEWRHCKCDSGIRRAKQLLDEFIGWDTDPETITTDKVAEMAEFYEKRGNSIATINRKKAALSAMLKIGRKYGRCTANPYIGLKDEKNKRQFWLTLEQEAELLSYARRHYGSEYEFFLMFLLDTGCRFSEALIAHVRNMRGDLYIIDAENTKNSKPRVVPLSQRLLERIPEAGYLFPSYVNRDTRHFYDKLNDIKDALGLDDEFVYHSLRHTCASRMVAMGESLQVVQQQLGHLHIQTTLRYAHLDISALQKARDKRDAMYNLSSI